MTMALTSPGFYVIACAWVMASFACPGGLLETGRLAPTSGLVRRVWSGHLQVVSNPAFFEAFWVVLGSDKLYHHPHRSRVSALSSGTLLLWDSLLRLFVLLASGIL